MIIITKYCIECILCTVGLLERIQVMYNYKHSVLTSRCIFLLFLLTDAVLSVTRSLWANIVGLASSVKKCLGFVYRCGAITYFGSITMNFSSKWNWHILAFFAGGCTRFSFASHTFIRFSSFQGRWKKLVDGSWFDRRHPGAQHHGILMIKFVVQSENRCRKWFKFHAHMRNIY